MRIKGDISIVPATKADIDFLVKLRKSTMTEHLKDMGINLSEDEDIKRVTDYFENAYIVLIAGQRGGLLKYLESPSVLQIIQMQVLPEFQGKGLGRYMLDYILKIAKKMKKPIELSVLKKNPAIKLYEKFGFKVVGDDRYEYHMRLIP